MICKDEVGVVRGPLRCDSLERGEGNCRCWVHLANNLAEATGQLHRGVLCLWSVDELGSHVALKL